MPINISSSLLQVNSCHAVAAVGGPSADNPPGIQKPGKRITARRQIRLKLRGSCSGGRKVIKVVDIILQIQSGLEHRPGIAHVVGIADVRPPARVMGLETGEFAVGLEPAGMLRVD